MRFNTHNYGGRDKQEAVSVQTNDPQQPLLRLVVKGRVEKFVDIRPAQVRLEGEAGTSLTMEVEILPNKEFPFTILGVTTQRNDAVRTELIEQCTVGENSRCVIRVENLKTTSGRYADTITVQTDNAVRPNFPISVVGIIR
ncbi:MAG: protein of unknown function DUF1573 [uncultured bacterium]|nr:MAG: protein of unknown function DUF1573 [uncultured bacterium]